MARKKITEARKYFTVLLGKKKQTEKETQKEYATRNMK